MSDKKSWLSWRNIAAAAVEVVGEAVFGVMDWLANRHAKHGRGY